MKKERTVKSSNHYTVTEVGALIKSFRSDIKVIAEGYASIDKRLERVEVELHGNSRRLDTLELSNRVINDRVGRLEDAVSMLSKDLKATRTELRDTRVELKQDIKGLGDRLTIVERR